MPPTNQRPAYLTGRGVQDLADQIVRATALADQEKEINKLVAERQKWHPGKGYIRIGGSLAGTTVLLWVALALGAVATDGPRVGRPIAITLALAASLLICTTHVAVGGWRDYREHQREAHWESIRAHDNARLHRETAAEVRALTDRVDLLVEAVEALTPETSPEPQRDWAALARMARDPNGAPDGVIPLIEGRPGRNRSSS